RCRRPPAPRCRARHRSAPSTSRAGPNRPMASLERCGYPAADADESACPMISFDDYARYDATALADLVRRREVSPGELLEVAIARAEAVNPKLNAIVVPMHDVARERARGPLEGP